MDMWFLSIESKRKCWHAREQSIETERCQWACLICTVSQRPTTTWRWHFTNDSLSPAHTWTRTAETFLSSWVPTLENKLKKTHMSHNVEQWWKGFPGHPFARPWIQQAISTGDCWSTVWMPLSRLWMHKALYYFCRCSCDHFPWRLLAAGTCIITRNQGWVWYTFLEPYKTGQLVLHSKTRTVRDTS